MRWQTTRMTPVPASSRRQVQGEISLLIAQCRLAPAPIWPASAHSSAAASACLYAIIVCAVRGCSRYWHDAPRALWICVARAPDPPRANASSNRVCILYCTLAPYRIFPTRVSQLHQYTQQQLMVSFNHYPFSSFYSFKNRQTSQDSLKRYSFDYRYIFKYLVRSFTLNIIGTKK